MSQNIRKWALIGPYRALWVVVGPIGPGPLPKRRVANILFFAQFQKIKNSLKIAKKVKQWTKTSTGPKTDFLGRKKRWRGRSETKDAPIKKFPSLVSTLVVTKRWSLKKEGILGTRGYFGYHLEGVTGIAQWSCTRTSQPQGRRFESRPPRGGGGRSIIINQRDQS